MRTVAELVRLPKQIERANRVPKRDGHEQINFAVVASDGSTFQVYVRMLRRLPESFSFGLTYLEGGERYLLRRLNGDHREHANPDGRIVLGGHIHQPVDDSLAPVPGDTLRFAVEVAEPPNVRTYWSLFKAMISLQCERKDDEKIDLLQRELFQLSLLEDDGDDDD